MDKLTFTLKQHTPLIHFQHDQAGATLRATEVKPKLDRFLIDQIGIQELREKRPDWFINNLHDALDYQMTISVPDLFSYPIADGFPCFFGNMGNRDSSKQKQFVFSESPIKIKLTSKCDQLIKFFKGEKGKKVLDVFFNKRTFASRQSKGFGSFSVIFENTEQNMEISNYYIDIPIGKVNVYNLRNQHNTQFPNLTISDAQLLLIENWRSLFYHINLFHKVLKSGYNQQGGYVKSSLFKYFKEVKQIQWDKKSIKEFYFTDKLSVDIITHPDEDILEFDENKVRSSKGNLFLIRDLLGLTSEAEWKKDYPKGTVISKANGDIDRFKSPLTYKPVLLSDD